MKIELNTTQTEASRTAALVGSIPLVRCFCVPADPTSCIYRRGDVIAYACDEEGVTLSQHYCSNEGFARSDIVGMGHEKEYAKRYPEGYRTEWVGTPPGNWDGDIPNTKFRDAGGQSPALRTDDQPHSL
tara:strand:+ start:1578 stop:1964 length:387 start_codon:yes stop_codon:yes gene_type:complete